MPKTKAQDRSAPVSRRLTRRGLQSLHAQQFAALPLELVRAIVVVAARDNVLGSAKWVAQSLALVCRDFRDAVDPVLVETVRLTDNNVDTILQHLDRFMQTKTVLLFSARASRYVFPNYCFDVLSPSALTISFMRESGWALIGPSPTTGTCLDHVTYLHLRNCYIEVWSVENSLPPRVSYLILDPDMTLKPEVHANPIRQLLAAHPQLVRLLVRTVLASGTLLHTLHVDALEQIADPRLWVDDSLPLTRAGESALFQHDEEQGLVLWYTGRQIYPGASTESCRFVLTPCKTISTISDFSSLTEVL